MQGGQFSILELQFSFRGEWCSSRWLRFSIQEQSSGFQFKRRACSIHRLRFSIQGKRFSIREVRFGIQEPVFSSSHYRLDNTRSNRFRQGGYLGKIPAPMYTLSTCKVHTGCEHRGLRAQLPRLELQSIIVVVVVVVIVVVVVVLMEVR